MQLICKTMFNATGCHFRYEFSGKYEIKLNVSVEYFSVNLLKFKGMDHNHVQNSLGHMLF